MNELANNFLFKPLLFAVTKWNKRRFPMEKRKKEDDTVKVEYSVRILKNGAYLFMKYSQTYKP